VNGRAFNAALRRISTRGKLDPRKMRQLPDDAKTELAHHIIRNRGPLVKDLIAPSLDRDWLAAMGYLYETRGKLFTFVHTGEHRIR
jgi:hypothetical protein